eukprot:COSAG04_NODE_2789_length_3573_cov_3.378526_4_plen_64_part_00
MTCLRNKSRAAMRQATAPAAAPRPSHHAAATPPTSHHANPLSTAMVVRQQQMPEGLYVQHLSI